MLRVRRLVIFGSFIEPTHLAVCLTENTVTDALYPIGAKGVLGYGIKAPPGSPPNCSLIPTLVGCVNSDP